MLYVVHKWPQNKLILTPYILKQIKKAKKYSI